MIERGIVVIWVVSMIGIVAWGIADSLSESDKIRACVSAGYEWKGGDCVKP